MEGEERQGQSSPWRADGRARCRPSRRQRQCLPVTPPHCCGFWPQRGHADRGPTVCHGLESPLPSARCRGRTGDEQWGRPGVSEFWILGPRTLIPGAATRAGLPVSSDTARALLPPASAARPFQPLGPFPPLRAVPARPRLSLAQTPKPLSRLPGHPRAALQVPGGRQPRSTPRV